MNPTGEEVRILYQSDYKVMTAMTAMLYNISAATFQAAPEPTSVKDMEE